MIITGLEDILSLNDGTHSAILGRQKSVCHRRRKMCGLFAHVLSDFRHLKKAESEDRRIFLRGNHLTLDVPKKLPRSFVLCTGTYCFYHEIS